MYERLCCGLGYLGRYNKCSPLPFFTFYLTVMTMIVIPLFPRADANIPHAHITHTCFNVHFLGQPGLVGCPCWLLISSLAYPEHPHRTGQLLYPHVLWPVPVHFHWSPSQVGLKQKLLLAGCPFSSHPTNSIKARVRTILVLLLGYWVLGNIHRYWVVLLLGDIFCCSDT